MGQSTPATEGEVKTAEAIAERTFVFHESALVIPDRKEDVVLDKTVSMRVCSGVIQHRST